MIIERNGQLTEYLKQPGQERDTFIRVMKIQLETADPILIPVNLTREEFEELGKVHHQAGWNRLTVKVTISITAPT